MRSNGLHCAIWWYFMVSGPMGPTIWHHLMGYTLLHGLQHILKDASIKYENIGRMSHGVVKWKICVIHMLYIYICMYIYMYIYICIHMFTCTEVQCQLSFRYAGITITKTGATYRRNTYHTSSTKIGDLKKRMECRWIVNGAMAELRKDTQGVHTSNFHNKTWEELNPLGISRCYGP